MLTKQDAALMPFKRGEHMSEEALLQQALDSNQILQEEINQLRRTNRMLRNINGALRRANDSLRRQQEQAVVNDEMFKQLCESGFGVPVDGEAGGLPAESLVETPVANGAEASTAVEPS
jgi:FtsZ-binding cell division protein ZapB